MTRSPQIEWDLGTAYDFFISLVVLHKPGDHGLRGECVVPRIAGPQIGEP